MRPIQTVLLLFSTSLILIGLTGHASAEIKGELVSTKRIWDQAPIQRDTDLARFKDRWFVVCCETSGESSQDGALRVISSEDGDEWESVALIKSPTPKKGLYHPAFTSTPDGRLMITAQGIVPNPDSTVPLPQWGGTTMTMAWFSKDGRSWSEPSHVGLKDYSSSRVVWNQDIAFHCGHGQICGNSQTIQFLASKDGTGFESLYERTFSGFFPVDMSIVFDGDRADCLMSRYNSKDETSARRGLPWQAGLLGTSKAPYTDWEWKEINTPFAHANLLRLPDRRIIAVVGLTDPKARMSLCEFDLAAGKLTEFLELPIEWQRRVGLADHGGHVWLSYHATHDGKLSVHLAKVTLSAAPKEVSAAKAKPTIEYRWMENFYIKDVTQEREIYASEDINQHWFLHKKPIDLTKEARQKLVMELEKGKSKWLAVLIDGHYRMSLIINKTTFKDHPEIFDMPSTADAEVGQPK